jgi:hypothetical protein
MSVMWNYHLDIYCQDFFMHSFLISLRAQKGDFSIK